MTGKVQWESLQTETLCLQWYFSYADFRDLRLKKKKNVFGGNPFRKDEGKKPQFQIKDQRANERL